MGDISLSLRAVTVGGLALLAALAVATPATAKPAGAGQTFPVSWLEMEKGSIPGANSGTSGMGFSSSPSSTDGRFVLFASMSDNLGPQANPNNFNLFRKDMQTGDVVLVNRLDGPSGASTPGAIYSFDMSGDGNLVTMIAERKLTADDTDDEPDVYLRDIAAGTTTLLTPGTVASIPRADLSADGAYLSFATQSPLVAGDVNGLQDVYRSRISDGTIDIVSRIPALPNAGNAASSETAISGDGRWVAFASAATNLVPGFTDNNGAFNNDVFVRDMTDGTTYLASSRFNSSTQSSDSGSDEPRIAGTPGALAEVDVAFTSYGTDLTDNGITDPDGYASVYLKQMPSQASDLISRASGPDGANADSRAHTPSISDDSSKIVYSSDASNLGTPPDYYGVYMRNRNDNSTRLVSARNEYAVWGLISGNGAHGVWTEQGGGTPDSDPDLTGVFRRNLGSNQIRLVSRPKGNAKVLAPGFNNYSFGDSHRVLSANGRYMVFSTWSSRLPSAKRGAAQVYRRDLANGRIVLVSRANGPAGAIAGSAVQSAVSADGNRVAFVSHSQLDPADTNDRGDIYLRDIAAGTTTLVSRADGAGGAVSDKGAENPSINADGSVVAFESEATNMGSPGTDRMIYVRDLGASETRIASRATGVAGALANSNNSDGVLSADGSKVVFGSYATNLSPDDPGVNRSIYVRELSTNETRLVSRAPGPAGASLPGYSYHATISLDGTHVAFETTDDAAVPATAPWAVDEQVVVRKLDDGTNTLGSSSPGGTGGNGRSEAPSLSADGSILAFHTEATNLRNDIDVTGSRTVAVKNLADGSVSGPPLFGDPDSPPHGSRFAEVSGNGNCVLFAGEGHNAISGDLGNFTSTYIYVRSGTCQDPKALVPKLSAVTLKPNRFRVAKKATAKTAAKKKRKARAGTRIRFSLNTAATVTIRFEQKLKGRKAGKKCVKPTARNKRKKACTRFVSRGRLVRKNLAAGKRAVPFSGRVGRKALRPGKYRIVLRATGPGGVSAKVRRSFRIVRK